VRDRIVNAFMAEEANAIENKKAKSEKKRGK
jgi:hypothetical protein